MRNVIAFEAVVNGPAVILSCYADGKTESTRVGTLEEAALWLTKDRGVGLEVVWSTRDFERALITLAPEEKREELEKGGRVYVGNVKFFSVPRYLGITVTRSLRPGFAEKNEVNLYPLDYCLTDDYDEPKDVAGVAQTAKYILRAFDIMGIPFVAKLPSPVAVFSDAELDPEKLPTIWSFPEDKLDAMIYASNMMDFEWRAAYQVGFFPRAYLFDLTSAYPSIMAQLPSTDACRCDYSETVPDWAQWGIMKGKVTVTADVSPLVYQLDPRHNLNPKGTWSGYFTTEEIDWLQRWHAGSFKIDDGWFFRFTPNIFPYRVPVQKLYKFKLHRDPMVSTIAKRASNGIGGKLAETKENGDYGDLYNPVLAAMTRSRCRLQVGDFIFRHELQPDLVSVQVDGVLGTRTPELPPYSGMGSWRVDSTSPAIVLGKGEVWRPGKKPQGIEYSDLLKALATHPDDSYYEFRNGTRSIDLLMGGGDRDWDNFPRTGAEVLKGAATSTAIVIEE